MPTHYEAGTYDVIVIGAGHAGVEAAYAASKNRCENINVNNQLRI